MIDPKRSFPTISKKRWYCFYFLPTMPILTQIMGKNANVLFLVRLSVSNANDCPLQSRTQKKRHFLRQLCALPLCKRMVPFLCHPNHANPETNYVENMLMLYFWCGLLCPTKPIACCKVHANVLDN